jgi:hypothetical protein
VQVGTVTSASGGTQKYAVRSTFTTTLGVHTVTVQKPASGYVYLERIRGRRAGATGIAFLGAPLGGSSLHDMTVLRTNTGNQVPGIAISGNAGLDAYYSRTDIDINLSSFVVNDSGAWTTGLAGFTGTYAPSLAYAVQQTRAMNTQLVEIVEMAGSYYLPSQAGDNRRTFDAIRDLLILTGRQNNHVLTVDWHGATILDDMNLYATRYYNPGTITGDLNTVGGTYSGDFIHPNEFANARGVAMLCSAVGVSPPPFSDSKKVRNDRLTDLGGPLARTNKTFTVDSVTVRESAAAGWALQLAVGQGADGQPRLPYYVDHSIWEESGMRATVLAAGTSDTYGAYVSYTNAAVNALSNRTGVAGDWYTVTVLAQGVFNISTSGRIRQDGVMLPDGAPTAIGFDPGTVTGGPIAYTFEWSPKDDSLGGKQIQVLNGKIYEFSVIHAAATPLVSHKGRANAFIGVGPEQRLDTDPAFVSAYLGQRYFEDLIGDGSVILRKKLVSSGIKWNFTGQAPAAGLVGVYESMDRTTANYRLARQLSGTQSTSPYLGGGGEQASSNPGIQIGTAFPINVAGNVSVVLNPAYLTGVAGARICFQNAGTFRYLTPAGAWSATSQRVWDTTVNPMQPGQNYVLTFALPTGADLTALGNTPDFRVEWQGMSAGQPVGSATIVRGNSGCV